MNDVVYHKSLQRQDEVPSDLSVSAGFALCGGN